EGGRAAILYITDKLGVIHGVWDEVAVMYAGEVVEQGPARQVFARPRHPYTVALLDCLPRVDAPPERRTLAAIEGALPDPTGELHGCQFAPRCRLAADRCCEAPPPWVEVAPGHGSRCVFADRVPAPGERGREARPAGPAGSRPARPLLAAQDLVHHFRAASGAAGWGRRVVRALDGVSLEVAVGETLAVVGESGSGKTTVARCVVGLLRPTGGRIRLEGTPLPRRLLGWPRALRRRLQIVFQNPDLTLNPRRTIVEAVARPLQLFGLADRRTRRCPATPAPAPAGR